jgi:DNA-binding NarL/FixJ family response regulator
MKVAVVDDSRLFQDSVARLLASVHGVDIVGYAEDIDSAWELIDRTEPDVVLLDVDLRGGERGIEVLRRVARDHPRTQVVGLSSREWQALRPVYLQAGAAACFDKATEFEQARDWIAARVLSRTNARHCD